MRSNRNLYCIYEISTLGTKKWITSLGVVIKFSFLMRGIRSYSKVWWIEGNISDNLLVDKFPPGFREHANIAGGILQLLYLHYTFPQNVSDNGTIRY